MRVPDVESRLRQLVDDRVLVIEDRGGIPRVELTHDTLARLALDRRAEREARRRRVKAIVWTAASLAIAGVSLGLTALALEEKLRADRQTTIARERAAEAEQESNGALDLIRFMDSQVQEDFVDSVPVPLRERVSARVDAFYTSHRAALTALGEQEVLRYYLHKTQVHFAAIRRYEGESMPAAAKKVYIRWERNSAAEALQEALRLGESLAQRFPNDHGVTRDRILAHYYLSQLSRQLADKEAAIQHLRDGQALLDELGKNRAVPKVVWIDWMGLPNLDALLGDLLAEEEDTSGAQAAYKTALELQMELATRPNAARDRQEELERLQKLVKDAGSAKPKPQL